MAGNQAFPVNKGALCIKGFTSGETLDHPERLRTPLVADQRRDAGPGVVGRGARPHRVGRARDPGELRAARRRRLRRRVAHEREGLPARQVRARRARHARTSTTTAASACRQRGRRGDPRVRRRPRAALPRRGHRAGGRHPARRGQPRRDDAAADAVLRRRSARRRLADRRRSAAHADGAVRRRCTCGSRRAPTPRSPTACCTSCMRDGAIDRLRRASAPKGSSELRGVIATLLARARREDHRRPGSAARARGAPARRGAKRPMVLTARGAEQQSQGVEQRRSPSSISRSRSGGTASRSPASARSPARGTARAAASTGRRPTSCPAIAGSTTRRRARTSRACGAFRRDEIPGPGRSAYELLDELGRDGGVRALLPDGLQPGRVGPARAARRGAAARARPARRRRLLPLRDRRARRRRAAERAVGRGGRHDDEPRGARHPAPRARRIRRPACAPTSRSSRRSPSGSARGEHFAFDTTPRRCSTSCGAPPRAASPTTPASRTSSIEARAGRVLAVPVRGHAGHAAPLRRALRDAERPRAVPRRASRVARRGARRASTRSTSRPAACSSQYQSGTQTRRVGELARRRAGAARGDPPAHRAARRRRRRRRS